MRPATLPHHRTCGFPHPAVEHNRAYLAARVDGKRKPFRCRAVLLSACCNSGWAATLQAPRRLVATPRALPLSPNRRRFRSRRPADATSTRNTCGCAGGPIPPVPRIGLRASAKLEVSPPASHVSVPVVPQLRTRATAATVPLLSNSRLESLQTLRCYSDPLPAIQSKAQELAFPDPPCPALGGIHLQSQVLLDPCLYRRQRAFRCGLTAYVDSAVIRIPAVAVLPPYPVLLVEAIQVNVGQPR